MSWHFCARYALTEAREAWQNRPVRPLLDELLVGYITNESGNICPDTGEFTEAPI
jgi:hypothetical protein